jgi:hypothetical protein
MPMPAVKNAPAAATADVRTPVSCRRPDVALAPNKKACRLPGSRT